MGIMIGRMIIGAEGRQQQIGGNVVQIRSRFLREQRHEWRTRRHTQKDEAECVGLRQRKAPREQYRQRGADGEAPHKGRDHEADIAERMTGSFQIELEAHFQQAAGHEDRDCNAKQLFEQVRHVFPSCVRRYQPSPGSPAATLDTTPPSDRCRLDQIDPGAAEQAFVDGYGSDREMDNGDPSDSTGEHASGIDE